MAVATDTKFTKLLAIFSPYFFNQIFSKVAPSKESRTDDNIAIINITNIDCKSNLNISFAQNKYRQTAIKEADVPNKDIPPLDPVSSILHVIIDIGLDFDNTPISLATVSAITEVNPTITPSVKVDLKESGVTRINNAHKAGGPVFAIACQNPLPLCSMRVFILFFSFLPNIVGIPVNTGKKRNNKTNPCQPNPKQRATPIIQPPKAPSHVVCFKTVLTTANRLRAKINARVVYISTIH